ncbi:unnamed protein product [Symbiodinium sp. CCMP2592]|nr:unnamed protein product [Symbiodinium sp. CCMP2592]
MEQILTALAQMQANAPAASTTAPLQLSNPILQQLLSEAARPKPQFEAQAVLPPNIAQMIAVQLKKEMEASGQGVQQPQPESQAVAADKQKAPRAEKQQAPAANGPGPSRMPGVGSAKGPASGSMVRESDIMDVTGGKPWTKADAKTKVEDKPKPERSVLSLCKIMTFEYVDNQMVEVYARVINKPGFKRKAPEAPAKLPAKDDQEPAFEEETTDADDDKDAPQSSMKPPEPNGFLAALSQAKFAFYRTHRMTIAAIGKRKQTRMGDSSVNAAVKGTSEEGHGGPEATDDVAKLHRESEAEALSPRRGAERPKSKPLSRKKKRRCAEETVPTPKVTPKRLKFSEPEPDASEDPEEDGEDDDDQEEEVEEPGSEDDDVFNGPYALKDKPRKQLKAIEDKPPLALEDEAKEARPAETPQSCGLDSLPRDLGNKLKKLSGDLLETLTGDFGSSDVPHVIAILDGEQIYSLTDAFDVLLDVEGELPGILGEESKDAASKLTLRGKKILKRWPQLLKARRGYSAIPRIPGLLQPVQAKKEEMGD